MTDMDRYELAKPDFDVIDAALKAFLQQYRYQTPGNIIRAEKLRDLFSEAHSGHLEMERD